ncbi:hypothetical protein DSECCO2_264460 [anaerobic digester metagenome]
MKKAVSISFIALSTLVLMLVAIVPHHHHEGTACIVTEYCEQDDAINDEHTHHGNIPKGDDQSCVAEVDYIASSFNNGIKYKVAKSESHDDNSYSFLFSVYFLVSDFILNPEYLSSKSDYGEFISFYKSAEANQFNGLRAPPYLLS